MSEGMVRKTVSSLRSLTNMLMLVRELTSRRNVKEVLCQWKHPSEHLVCSTTSSVVSPPQRTTKSLSPEVKRHHVRYDSSPCFLFICYKSKPQFSFKHVNPPSGRADRHT